MQRTLQIVSLVLLSALTGACGPSEADCRKLVAHVRALTGRTLNADEMARKCQDELSRQEIECGLAARSVAELEKCAPSAP